MTATRLTVQDLALRRLAAQFLTVPGPATPPDVVRALGAIQAQDYSGAKWAVSQRTGTPTPAPDAEIERELTAGSILRTHVLRPTWHFVAPADIRWMLALTAPRVKQAMTSANRELELDATVFKRSNAAIVTALASGAHLTRDEIRPVVARAGIGLITGRRLGHLMMQAELDALVCSGARKGKQFTYALLDERVPSTPRLDRDEALLELVRRYFTTRGPATPHDFAWWSGLTVADAKRGMQAAGRELEVIEVDGKSYWVHASAPPVPRATHPAHLLPNYDEFFIGFRDRGAIAQRAGDLTAVTGGNALIPHVVIVDGQLVGAWKRFLEKTSVIVELRPFAPLTSAETRRIAEQAHRFGEFLGMSVRIKGVRPQ
jgi:hypothetical protein